MQVINSNVVIQFSIMDAAPPVQVEDIYWNFTTSSGMTTPITNIPTISLSLDRLTLTINNAQLSHTGSYMITVSNPAGSSTGSVQLTVLGKWQWLAWIFFLMVQYSLCFFCLCQNSTGSTVVYQRNKSDKISYWWKNSDIQLHCWWYSTATNLMEKKWTVSKH